MLALVFTVLLALPGTAAAAGPVEIGIADQKADMFADERFVKLGIGHVRLNVGWDAMSSPRQVAHIDRWLAAARERDVEPLVSFGHSLTRRRSLPTPERLRFEFRRVRERYPWVWTFATWNEANHCGEPTCHRAGLVAGYYRALTSECVSCRILAAELLDLPSVAQWIYEFRRRLGYTPRLWGLHNYVEANRFTTTRLDAMLRAIPGARLWLTETGGLVSRRNRSTTDIPEGPTHAGKVTRYIFDRIVPRYPRIDRVYLYHWNARPNSTWDSGLITPAGRVRTALYVLERVLLRGSPPLGGETASRRR